MQNLERLTMDEYIKREAAVKSVLRMRRPENSVAQNRMLSIIQMDMLKLPAADVAPVVYGRWAHLGGDEWCCSVCGFVITTEGSWVKPAKKILRGLRGQDGRRCWKCWQRSVIVVGAYMSIMTAGSHFLSQNQILSS